MLLSVAQLLNHYTPPVTEEKPEQIPGQKQLVRGMLNRTFRRYEHAMKDGPFMPAEQIAGLTGTTKFVVTQQMRKLYEAKYVERMVVKNRKGRPMYLWRWKQQTTPTQHYRLGE